MEAVGVVRAKPLDQDPVPSSLEDEPLVAIAQDQAVAAAVVPERCEWPERVHHDPGLRIGITA